MVVGLGNPGKGYEATRHNVGYRVLDALKKNPPAGVHLFKPTGFMNTSGVSVAEKMRHMGCLPQDLMVVCDDFALPLGALRLRLKGSSGGHNGLDSILEILGTLDVPRLRVGIGPVPPGDDPAEFVLAPFPKKENSQIHEMVEQAAEAVRLAISEGIEAAMNRFNQKPVQS